MARPFKELRDKMGPERRARNKAAAEEMLRELPLQELRKARQLSQEQIAVALKIKQSSVSKMENNADVLISTLRRFIAAMGGRLVIRAEFPDGVVDINQFSELEEPVVVPA